MKKVLITGADGKIGKVLTTNLKYPLTKLDLPRNDARDINILQRIFPGHDVVIHLAWDTKTEHFRSEKISPGNALMTYNVYQAALESNVPRVVMASSVHADHFYHWLAPQLPNKNPTPDSPYGASKVFMEALGRYYATRGLEVICIRFGGVNASNTQPTPDSYEAMTWLTHHDCVSLINKCIAARIVPSNYVLMNAVSDNLTRVHDWSNPLGWKPRQIRKPLK